VNYASPYRRGASLVEVLVVIVIFLIGILAVAQVFPGGLQVLMTTRNNSVASALARDEMERLKARPDQLPEKILPIRIDNGQLVEDPNRRPNDLTPMGNELLVNGQIAMNGTPLGPWPQRSGANNFNRIIGEGGRVPAPRQVGNLFGGLMVLQFGPVAPTPNPADRYLVYGNDLQRRTGLPHPEEVPTGQEFFVGDLNSPDAHVRVPRLAVDRAYRMNVSVIDAANRRRDFFGKTFVVPATGPDPLPHVYIRNVVEENIRSAELGSIRVAPLFMPVNVFNPNDPYQYAVLNANLGVLLFNPAGYAESVPDASGARTPLTARVDYWVDDWRVIREEFRVPADARPRLRLALQSIKVGGNPGPDGRPQQAIFLEQGGETSHPLSDHFVLMDLQTGGLFYERNPGDGNPAPLDPDIRPGEPADLLIRVDKNQGLVQIVDVQRNVPGVQGLLLLPDGTRQIVEVRGRPVRVLYMANQEWSVQVMKAASQYGVSYDRPGAGAFYIGGTSPLGGTATRIYFPPMDAGRKVSVGQLTYVDTGGNERQLVGQDFVLREAPADALGLPYLDVRQVDPQAAAISEGGARDIQGASVAVRVMWNNATFSLVSDPAENMRRLDVWGRNWRRTTTETYLRRGEMSR
jgi:type II secretory pathway pseudopilin PulG